jgi:hypothetical protein
VVDKGHAEGQRCKKQGPSLHRHMTQKMRSYTCLLVAAALSSSCFGQAGSGPASKR